MMPEQKALNTADLINARFGIRTASFDNPELAAAGAVAARVFRNNPRRLALVIINLSVNAMYLALTQDVGVARGIYITPNGGPVSMSVEDDFDLVTREWWIVAPAGASNLYSLSTEIF